MDSGDYSDDFEKPGDAYDPFSAEQQTHTKDTYVGDSAPSPTAAHRATQSQDALAGMDEELERVAILEAQPASISNPYQTLKRIQKENADLRAQLRHLNDQLDSIIERKTAAPRAVRTSAVTQSRSSEQQLKTAQKKLELVKRERDKMYEKLQRLVDPTYSASLTQDVEDLRRRLDRLQRQNRSKSQGQRGREKSLERYAHEDEISQAMKEIIEEKGNIRVLREKVAGVEEEIERMASSLVSLEEREETLQQKYSEVKAEAEALGISVSSESKRKRLLEELQSVKEACKRELGVSILSIDTQVKKLRRREAELQVELQSRSEEAGQLAAHLESKQQAVAETSRQLVELGDLTAGTDAEYLAAKALRRVRTKSREISIPLEDRLPRSTKSSEPGARELLNVRVRPIQSQSSKSLLGNPAPKPPLKPRHLPKPSRDDPKSERRNTETEEAPLARAESLPPINPYPTESLPPLNPYQAATDTLNEGKTVEEKPVKERSLEEPPLFTAPDRRSESRDSDRESPVRELPPLKPPYPRDRSHLILHEETQDIAPPLGLLERKALRQRSRPSETPSKTSELAKQAEERHAFFDPSDSPGFSDVQKQLVAIRSEQREEQTQQVVVQYKLQPHRLVEEDLV